MRRDSVWLASTSGEKGRVLGPVQAWDSLVSRTGRVLDVVNPWEGDTIAWPVLTMRTLGQPVRLLPLRAFRSADARREFLSPDGARAYIHVANNDTSDQYALVDADSSVVSPLDSGVVRWGRLNGWSGDGRALYADSDSGPGLLRLELDARRLRPTGQRTLLLPELRATALSMSFATQRNRVAIEEQSSLSHIVVGLLGETRGGTPYSTERVSPGSLLPGSAVLAAARNRLFFIAEADSTYGLFEMALPGGAPRRLTRLGGSWAPAHLRLSPDGSSAVVATGVGERWQSTLVDLRTGSTRTLSGWNPRGIFFDCHTFDWDPSGRFVLAYNSEEGSIIRMNAVTGAADTMRADSASHITCPAASPDGRWIAVRFVHRPKHGIRLLPLMGDSSRLFPAPDGYDHYPLGWLSPREVVVLQRPFSGDSSEVWIYNLGGSRSLAGRLPNPCFSAALAPGGHAIVCIERGSRSDVWIADDFDPYFRPPTAPKRP